MEALIGSGSWTEPDIEIRWRGHTFGHVFDRGNPDNDVVIAQLSSVLSLWPIIDFMLWKIYGDMNETERLEWYKTHADESIYIRLQDRERMWTVRQWSDSFRFRSFARLIEEEMGNVGPQPPSSQRH